jgi:Phage-related baseplate assembly protein.
MPRDKRSPGPRPYSEPGPFEAIVVSHLDPNYMGTLQVELLRKTKTGSLPERSGQLVEVRYLNPFYGVTPLADVSANDGYAYTQKSYGMWFVPPDVGSRVLVIFAEGDISQGFWIGCVQDKYMNFMVPDGRASTEITTEATPSSLRGKKLPCR